MAEKKLTGSNTHIATANGYDQRIIEEGEMVPAGIPVSDVWMRPVGKDGPLLAATAQALDPNPDDVDLNTLKGAALQGYAASLGITPGKLSDDDLRTAITAKRQPTA